MLNQVTNWYLLKPKLTKFYDANWNQKFNIQRQAIICTNAGLS